MDDFLSPDYMPFSKAKWAWWNVFGKDMRSEFVNNDKYYYMLSNFMPYPVHWVGYNEMKKKHEPLPSIDRNRTAPTGFYDQPTGLDSNMTDVFPVPCVKNYDKCLICRYASNNNIENYEKLNFFALAKRLPDFKSVVIDFSPTRFSNIVRNYLDPNQLHDGMDTIVNRLLLLSGIRYKSDFNTNPCFRPNYQQILNSNQIRPDSRLQRIGRSNRSSNNLLVNNIPAPSPDPAPRVSRNSPLYLSELDAKHIEFIWGFQKEKEWKQSSLQYALGEGNEEAEKIIEKLKTITFPDEIDFIDIILTRYENIMVYQPLLESFGRPRRRDDPEPTPFDRFRVLEI